MLFYKIDVELNGKAEEVERGERAERKSIIQSKSELFFEKNGCDYHLAVAGQLFERPKPILCAAAKNDKLNDLIVADYLQETEINYKQFSVQEITLNAYFNLLRNAARNDFVSDEDDIYEKLNLSGLDRRTGRRDIRFSETVVLDEYTHKEIMDISSGMLCAESLTAEIDRIFKGTPKTKPVGHPVHYLTQTDSRETRDKILRTLISALYQNGRLQSRRYCSVSFDGNDYLPEDALNTLYESCAGGTMLVSFGEEDSSDSEHARTGTDVIAGLCAAMRKHKNRVLTIFCLPKSAVKIKDIFLEHLGAVTVVPIREEAAFQERAKAYLRTLAKQQGATPNKALYAQIAGGKGYTAKELHLFFDLWYDKQLKSRIYKQYAELETANKQVAVKKPKGNAYDELSRMVGLSEAKAVIQQALNFYKAQKLFREKGFSAERPAMHMIFTGNPGTAKTTVARLFAQIMRDNDLLSVGDLYEVGRADLVGKYVGWTAPTVKAKFKMAKGSVLFIDEAYSLVDDKDGLYGDEAINTIVQEMENYREDMVVIFAGYPDKMEDFLQKNPGLRSRIAFHVPFADYNAEELCRITGLMADNQKLRLGEGVPEKLTPIFEAAMKADDFGNGRYARNLFEKAVMKQASRLIAMDVDEVTVSDIERLLPEDFEAPAAKSPEKRKIGFAG